MSALNRVLIIADIHANLAALDAVLLAAGRVDAVLCLGDIVGYGPQPLECLHRLQEVGATAVRGNHDECALTLGSQPLIVQPELVTDGRSWDVWTAAQLDAEALAYLRALPSTMYYCREELAALMSHNLPGVRGYVPAGVSNLELAGYIPADAPKLVLFAHSHVALHRRLPRCEVLNPGSVGQPRHGQPIASYALWESGSPRLCQVDYCVTKTVAALDAMPMSPAMRQQWTANYLLGVVNSHQAG